MKYIHPGSGGAVRLATRTVSSPSLRAALPCFTGPVFTVRDLTGTTTTSMGLVVEELSRAGGSRVELTDPVLGSVEDSIGPAAASSSSRPVRRSS